MNISKFNQTKEKVRNLLLKSNEGWVKVYNVLAKISKEKLWTTRKFYGDDQRAYLYYSLQTFGNFIREAFGLSIYRYNRMEKIVNRFGKEGFVRYGFDSCSTLLNHTEEEINKILQEVQGRVATVRFSDISRDLFPKKKKSKTTKIREKNLDWKKKYEKLEKTNLMLQKLCDDLEKENQNLRQYRKDTEKRRKQINDFIGKDMFA